MQPLTGAYNTADSMALSIPLCDGQTLFNNVTCGVPTSPTTTGAPTSTEAPTVATTEAPTAIRSELLVVAITVPVLVLLLILVCAMALLMFYCVWSIRASKKRRHSLYAGMCLHVVCVCMGGGGGGVHADAVSMVVCLVVDD